MAKISTDNLSAAEVRRIAVEADADPRTVVRVLEGKRVRGMAEKRIKAVLGRSGKGSNPLLDPWQWGVRQEPEQCGDKHYWVWVRPILTKTEWVACSNCGQRHPDPNLGVERTRP